MTGLALPGEAIASYIAHVVDGRTLRECAAVEGVSPSTILRRVRRCELCRDLPEWEAIFGALEAAHARVARNYPLPPTRGLVAVALGTTEAAVHRECAAILSDLWAVGAVLVCGDTAPRAAVVNRGKPYGSISRAAVACALAFGWIEARPSPSGRLRCFAAAPAAVEARFAPGSSEALAARAHAPVSMLPVDVLARTSPEIFTADHVRLGVRFGDIFRDRDAARAEEWARVTAGLPDRHRSALEQFLIDGVGLASIEDRFGLVSRSGKVFLACILEALGHLLSGPEARA